VARRPAARREVPALGGSLPAELTSFVGRRVELSRIKRLTSEFRLVTLSGIGGIGKTRLAQRTAMQSLRAFPDGAWFVDLAGLGQLEPPGVRETESDVLARRIAAALGLCEGSARMPVRALCEQLESRCVLLVLDNCEHLLPACATLVHALLHSCPELRIVATSREPLGLIGEVTYPVPPLGTRDEAVALFAARAEAVQPGFRLTTENGAEVADICRRLDGLPLAIELAAARLPVLTPAQISARLDDRFALLTRGSRTAPLRHQTLRGCVDWSFELCWKPEQRLWARLSVFAGSFEVDAVEGICADDDLIAADLLDLTASLIDKSILTRDDHGPTVRYRMLETIRAYGHDKLHESGEDAALLRRHRDWYEGLVERANAEWVGDRQAYWLDRLSQEHANLRSAADRCLAEPGGAERALRIPVRLPDSYWSRRGMVEEGRRWLDRALEQTAAPTVQRARALLLASRLAFAQDDLAAWTRLLDQGEELARRLDDAAALSDATLVRGTVALFANDVPVAVEILERALTILDRAPRPEWEQRLRVLLALVAAAGLAGDLERATGYYDEALAIAELRGEGLLRSYAMWALGLAAWRRGDPRAATAHQLASLRLRQARGLDDVLGTALCLEALAWIEAGQQPRRAAVLLGAADGRWQDYGLSIASYRHLACHRQACERQSRDALGEPTFQEAKRHGRSLDQAEALAYALQEHRQAAAPPDPASRTPLTRREDQVAVLVARGLSNRDIARSLVISQRTAESHVANILTKQGFTTRAQIAAWVAERATRPPSDGHPDG